MYHRPFCFLEHLKPPFFDLKPLPLDVALGESGSFKCHVTGSAPLKVTWAKDNREIRPGGNYKITLVENTATLTILKVGKGDAGLYTCYASNNAGKDSCAAQLSFKGNLQNGCFRLFFSSSFIMSPKNGGGGVF